MENTQITTITPVDLQSAGAILTTNRSWLNKYKTRQAALLERAGKDGLKLSTETDKAINDWMVSAKTGLANMEAQRKPYTQKAQEFVKLFTTVENSLKEDYDVLQAIRDKSVSAYRKEEEEKRRQEEVTLRKKQERVNLLANAEQQVRDAFMKILTDEKNDLTKEFETNPNFKEDMEKFDPVFLFTQWEEISPTIAHPLFTKEELHAICTESKLDKFEKCAVYFKDEMKKYATYLVGMIGEKDAKALREDRLAQEEAARKSAELKAESERQRKIKEEQEAIELEQANRKLAEPDTRSIDSYSITVTGADGWRAIVEFYLSNGGGDDLEKITGKQMRAFAEKQAKKTGEMVVHDEVQYEITYKAVARKEKVGV